MPTITIVSMYNGRYHTSTIKRSERVCQIAIDDKIVFDDEEEKSKEVSRTGRNSGRG